VNSSDARRNWDRRPRESPDKPYNQGNYRSQQHEWQSENEKQPQACTAGKVRNVSLDLSPWIAAHASAKHGHSVHLCASIEAYVPAEGCGVAADAGILFDDNAPTEGGDVTVDAASNMNAAAKTGRIARTFISANRDVMAKLGAVVGTLCHSRCCERANQADPNQQSHG
jgi:hypothetical protein